MNEYSPEAKISLEISNPKNNYNIMHCVNMEIDKYVRTDKERGDLFQRTHSEWNNKESKEHRTFSYSK